MVYGISKERPLAYGQVSILAPSRFSVLNDEEEETDSNKGKCVEIQDTMPSQNDKSAINQEVFTVVENKQKPVGEGEKTSSLRVLPPRQ